MADAFDQITGAARLAIALTPSDGTKLPRRVRGVYVGTAGNVTLQTIDGAADVVLKNVPAGTFLPLQVSYIRATGTTAADFVGFV
jgi:hypothetical protein